MWNVWFLYLTLLLKPTCARRNAGRAISLLDARELARATSARSPSSSDGVIARRCPPCARTRASRAATPGRCAGPRRAGSVPRGRWRRSRPTRREPRRPRRGAPCRGATWPRGTPPHAPGQGRESSTSIIIAGGRAAQVLSHRVARRCTVPALFSARFAPSPPQSVPSEDARRPRVGPRPRRARRSLRRPAGPRSGARRWPSPSSRDEARAWLAQSAEATTLLLEGRPLPAAEVDDVREAIERARVGGVLAPAELRARRANAGRRAHAAPVPDLAPDGAARPCSRRARPTRRSTKSPRRSPAASRSTGRSPTGRARACASCEASGAPPGSGCSRAWRSS